MGVLCFVGLNADRLQAGEGDPGWRMDAGMSYLQLDPHLPRDLTLHTTHLDDRPFMSGSPGQTDLCKVDVSFLNLLFGYTWPLESQPQYGWSWGVAYVLKVPIKEDGREEIQNENDIRPSTQGSFIYTKVSSVKPQHEVGINLNAWRTLGGLRYMLTPRIYVGYWQLSFEKGWTRFGSDEMEQSSDAKGFGISPQIEGSVGTSAFKLGVFAAYRAMDLEYDTSVLGSSVAQGLEIGGAIGWQF
ncbi:MAG TPA: hypothetical protein DCZ95_17725 [Verrucomicrobia bacterium]|nr:hypothetical protein [Verrucomicrobiota bacterium]